MPAPLTGLREPLTGLRAPLTGLRAPLTDLRAPLTGLRAPLTDRSGPGAGKQRQSFGFIKHFVSFELSADWWIGGLLDGMMEPLAQSLALFTFEAYLCVVRDSYIRGQK